ncbi:hypothetical protein TKK_0002171 [Trichogramma kaykai]
MDTFFARYSNLKDLASLFEDMHKDLFFIIEDSELFEILKHVDDELKKDFIYKYKLEKSLLANQISSSIDGQFIEVLDSRNAVTNINKSLDNLEESVNTTNTVAATVDVNEFKFVENELYFILFNEKSGAGKLVLDKYRHRKTLDRYRLIDIVLMHYMYKNQINHHISCDTFLKITAQILELFPTESVPEIYYQPYREAKLTGGKNAKGLLYNHYNDLKEEFTEAGWMTHRKPDKSSSEVVNEDIETGILHNPPGTCVVRNDFTLIAFKNSL